MEILDLIKKNAVEEMPKVIEQSKKIQQLEKEFQILIKKIPDNDLLCDIEEINSRYLTEVYESAYVAAIKDIMQFYKNLIE